MTATTTIVIDKEKKNKCLICRQEAVSITAVEVLPNNGVLIQAVHADKTIHSWEDYNSVVNVVKRGKQNPKIILCPKCGEFGRVNSYHNYTNGSKRILYVIVHEKIPGTWGKGKHKISRRRKCYKFSKVQRDIIVTKLSKYIPSQQ